MQNFSHMFYSKMPHPKALPSSYSFVKLKFVTNDIQYAMNW